MNLISQTAPGRRHLRQSVRQLGASLGSTPAQVASNLSALRVVGKPRDASDCAIARYLSALVGAEQSVRSISVSDRTVHVTMMEGRVPVRIRLPRPICTFIQGFDSGSYPDLVDRSTPAPERHPSH